MIKMSIMKLDTQKNLIVKPLQLYTSYHSNQLAKAVFTVGLLHFKSGLIQFYTILIEQRYPTKGSLLQ